jgi:hypothetical protein
MARIVVRCRRCRAGSYLLDTHGHCSPRCRGIGTRSAARAKSLRDAIEATSWPGHQDPRSTRLVTFGHIFGGLIVYIALSQYFIDRIVQSELVPFSQSLVAERARAEKEKGKEIAGYGDLVIIVNPAIEAIRFQPIRELLENRRNANSFAPKQNPVFVEVTSDADWATGIAFPAGRLLNTTFESLRSDGRARSFSRVLDSRP